MQQDATRTARSISRTFNEARHIFTQLQSEATQLAALQLNASVTQLLALQRYLRFRVEWTPEQVKRQHERLKRHQARLQWQHAILAQLQEKQRQE